MFPSIHDCRYRHTVMPFVPRPTDVITPNVPLVTFLLILQSNPN